MRVLTKPIDKKEIKTLALGSYYGNRLPVIGSSKEKGDVNMNTPYDNGGGKVGVGLRLEMRKGEGASPVHANT